MPSFETRSTDGQILSDVGLLGQSYALFFFPKVFTPGCVRETKAFRDRYREFREGGLEIIGVSPCSHTAQATFSEWAGTAYPMVADPDRHLAHAFGVVWPFFPAIKRVTFLVDDRAIVRGRFHFELGAHRHVDAVAAALRKLGLAPKPQEPSSV